MRLLFRAIAILPAAFLTLWGCGEPAPLNEERATEIILDQMFPEEPVYAEVPARVWWNEISPKDDYDGFAVTTLEKLRDAGLVTLEHTTSDDGGEEWLAERTAEGVRALGVVPSARGKAFRGRIATRIVDEMVSFEKHPSRAYDGRAEVRWTYQKPTELYPLFDTKIDKPLDTPFLSVVAVSRVKGDWKVETIIRKKRE